MWLLSRLLGEAIRLGALEIVDHRGRVHRYGQADADPIRLRLADARTARAIGASPVLGAGEAYMDGRLGFERGDILALLDLVTSNLRWSRSNALRVKLWGRQRLMARWAELNERRRARRNAAHHYDLADRLYDLFLDAERQYSCAYFEEDNRGPSSDLDRAQRDKMALIARKLRLQPGMRVLDIGCGWGGLSRHLAAHHGVEVTGITLSSAQHAHAVAQAEALGLSGLDYRLEDYRDIKDRFDRIVSVGMFEHVGRPHYAAFFDRVADLLDPSGVALVHTIGRAGGPGATDPFTARYIFPGGYTPALSEIAPHVERAFLWLADLEVWRLHYAWTLEHWLARCRARRSEIEALYDARFFRMWEFYLAGAIMAFRHDDHCVFQLLMARERDSVPLTRDWLMRGEKAAVGAD